jgi:hypothetical protein
MISHRLAALCVAACLLCSACVHVPGSPFLNRPDPMYGRWQLNLVKSRLAPAPRWRSEALLIARDGAWDVRTAEYVYADSVAKYPVRYKQDGLDYPMAAPSRTHSFIRLGDNRWRELEKVKGVVVAVYDQTLAPDGGQLTVYHTMFDRNGKSIGTRVEVFDKVRADP